MTKHIARARAIGGLLAILVLLTLVLGDATPILDITMTDRHIMILSALISALLGVDAMKGRGGRE